jgi:serine/threonine protein kinase
MAPELPSCPSCQGPVADRLCERCGACVRAGDCRVERLLAQTSHSRVYLAQDAAGARVALKELVFALVPGAQEIDAFHREAQLLRQLQHPRIPRFVASFQEGAGASLRLYLAQEFIEGAPLSQRMAEHRFSAAEACHLAREVLEILQYLHELPAPLIHRDVKPANLLERPDGSIALVDFGAAREVRPGGTHRATLVGTFGYMAPEQLGGSADQTADLYGLGASLIHLLSRRPPEELLWSEPPADLSSSLNIGAPFARYLGSLVARRRESRYRTARAAQEALQRLQAEGPSALLPTPGATLSGQYAEPQPPRGSILPRGEAEMMLLPGPRSRAYETGQRAGRFLADVQSGQRGGKLAWLVLAVAGAVVSALLFN